jgi:hypothetical protein
MLRRAGIMSDELICGLRKREMASELSVAIAIRCSIMPSWNRPAIVAELVQRSRRLGLTISTAEDLVKSLPLTSSSLRISRHPSTPEATFRRSAIDWPLPRLRHCCTRPANKPQGAPGMIGALPSGLIPPKLLSDKGFSSGSRDHALASGPRPISPTRASPRTPSISLVTRSRSTRCWSRQHRRRPRLQHSRIDQFGTSPRSAATWSGFALASLGTTFVDRSRSLNRPTADRLGTAFPGCRTHPVTLFRFSPRRVEPRVSSNLRNTRSITKITQLSPA